MSGSETQIVCRVARMSDEQGVVKMYPGMFHGQDYLPHRWREFMDNPDIICYVAVKDDKPVGFTYREITDGGRSLYSGGLRVSPAHQGQGISQLLNEFADHDAISWAKAADAERLIWSTAHLPSCVKNLESTDTELISIRNELVFIMTTAELCHLTKDASFGELENKLLEKYSTAWLDGQDAVTFLTETNTQPFAQDGTWLIDWQPYLPLTSNYKTIFERTSLLIVKSKTKQDESNGDSIEAVAFSTAFPVDIGNSILVDFFPHQKRFDPDLLVAVLINHFKQTREVYHDTKIAYALSCPQRYFSLEMALSTLRDRLNIEFQPSCLMLILAQALRKKH